MSSNLAAVAVAIEKPFLRSATAQKQQYTETTKKSGACPKLDMLKGKNERNPTFTQAEFIEAESIGPAKV